MTIVKSYMLRNAKSESKYTLRKPKVDSRMLTYVNLTKLYTYKKIIVRFAGPKKEHLSAK